MDSTNYWTELTKDFTPYIRDRGQLVEIDPSNIVKEWGDRGVRVIFIGNIHNSGTLADQTRKFISMCIKETGVGERAIVLAEGLKPGVDQCGLSLFAPKKVRVIGADCRVLEIGEPSRADYVDKAKTIDRLITKANAKSYNDIKNLSDIFVGLTSERALVIPTCVDYSKLGIVMKEWSEEDLLINKNAANILKIGTTPSDDDHCIFEGSNNYLAEMIKKYYSEDGLIFVPWGIAHFNEVVKAVNYSSIKPLTFYEQLNSCKIKPLVLLPKEENTLDYLIESCRYLQAIQAEPFIVKRTFFIEAENGEIDKGMPRWMSLMVKKVTESIGLKHPTHIFVRDNV